MQQHVRTEIRLLHLQCHTNGHFYFLIIVDFATSGALLQLRMIFKVTLTRYRRTYVLEHCVEKYQYVSHMTDPFFTLQ